MQTVLIKVSNSVSCIYHEIDSQLIFLNFKAGFGNWRFTRCIAFILYAWFLHIAHRIFFTIQKQYR